MDIHTFTGKKKYSFQDFLEIIETLRSEHGCPWDKEQTHESLRPCIMEESAELVAAIRIYQKTGDYDNLLEELGDVLLQVVMQSQIASEEGIFTMEDVIQEISRKMVRRHPHVFGDVFASDSKQVLKNWEEIKKEEKKDKDAAVIQLSEIPLELPALTRAQKVLKKAEKYHGSESYRQCYESFKELAGQLENVEHLSKEEKNEKFGQALLRLSNLARLSGVHAEQSLSDVLSDVIEQYTRG